MISADLQRAIDSLRIEDVYVRDQFAKCLNNFNPKYSEDVERLNIEQMHVVKQSNIIEIDGETRVLQVLIRLGARWVDPDEKSEELSVQAMIEAEFIAEYEILDTLEQASINEFCLNNASYHIWPYWREFLSSQCMRMHLPKLTLPTIQFAQNHQRDKAEAATRE